MSVSGRVSYIQLETLWEFLNSNMEIAMGYNKSCQARDKSRKLWMEVTENLNSLVGGAIKDSKGWTAYWIGYKGKIERKFAAIRLSHSRTGGGPSDLMSLTEVEKKYLNILGEDFGLGLPGIQVNPFDETDNQLAPSTSTSDSPSILLNMSCETEIAREDEVVLETLRFSPSVDSNVELSTAPSPTLAQPFVASTKRRRHSYPSMSMSAARKSLSIHSLFTVYSQSSECGVEATNVINLTLINYLDRIASTLEKLTSHLVSTSGK